MFNQALQSRKVSFASPFVKNISYGNSRKKNQFFSYFASREL